MKNRIGIPKLIIISLSLTFLVAAPRVFADDVKDTIDEALENYKNGNFTQAAENLDYAAQLIRQKKGGQLEDMLPAPLSGWTADDASSQAFGSAMIGGGVTARRSFSKKESSITVTITADSPMLQGMMMMFTNPMLAASDGGKLEKVAGQKAIVKYNASGREGSLNIVCGRRYLVSVEGNNIEKKDLTDYAAALDYKALEKLQ